MKATVSVGDSVEVSLNTQGHGDEEPNIKQFTLVEEDGFINIIYKGQVIGRLSALNQSLKMTDQLGEVFNEIDLTKVGT